MSTIDSPNPASDSPSLLVLMRLIHRRPGMYIGEIDGNSLARLESVIFGYAWAARHHAVRDDGVGIYDLFPNYLSTAFGWSMARGPAAAISELYASPQEAWDRFWALLWTFVELQGASGPIT